MGIVMRYLNWVDDIFQKINFCLWIPFLINQVQYAKHCAKHLDVPDLRSSHLNHLWSPLNIHMPGSSLVSEGIQENAIFLKNAIGDLDPSG